MKAVFVKQLGCLRPVDEQGEEMLSKIKMNGQVTVEVKKARNPNHHRKMFALLNTVYENTDERFPSVDALLTVVKIMVGHCDTVIDKNGNPFYCPKSINFASMDQTAFNEFYDKSLDAICKRIMPGTTREELEGEVQIKTGRAA